MSNPEYHRVHVHWDFDETADEGKPPAEFQLVPGSVIDSAIVNAAMVDEVAEHLSNEHGWLTSDWHLADFECGATAEQDDKTENDDRA